MDDDRGNRAIRTTLVAYHLLTKANLTVLDDIDHDLHDALERTVRLNGPQDITWLTRHARKLRRDARIDEQAVLESAATSTLLVERPDGTIDHLVRVLDGIVLTQRVRARTDARTDLWATTALQPLLNLLAFTSLPVVGGGEVTRSPFGHEALVGPRGWLPAAEPFELLAVHLEGGQVRVERCDETRLPALEQQQHARELLAHHYRRERWWKSSEELETRPGELVRALGLARLEDPTLFRTPYPPLDELLHDALERDIDQHHWRDFAAVRQGETVSFYVTGMPEALHMELDHRARQYGMSFDQFVIAVLGHLAWRTPFAEDMQPWEDWDPEHVSEGAPTAIREEDAS